MEHPQEEIYRIRQQIQYQLIDPYWYKKNPKKNIMKYDKSHSILTNHSIEGFEFVLNSTNNDFQKFQVLNAIIDNLLKNTKWNYDFRNNIEGQHDLVHKIDVFDYSKGDSRYLYELSRLHALPMLAVAYHVTNDIFFYDALICILREWIKQNPFMGTIAWKSGNEVGIRTVNLVYCRAVFDKVKIPTDSIDNILNPLIELHYNFLKNHLSLYSSKGNHHLGELAGLMAIEAAYHFEGNAEALRKHFNELNKETLRLIHEDGFNREQAMRYHATYINLIITSFSLAQSRGLTIPPIVSKRIEEMYHILASFRIGHKVFHQIGDEDNAELLYPYFDKEYNEYESVLNDSVVLFNHGKKGMYHFDMRNYLLFGDAGLETYQKTETEIEHIDEYKLYKDSGYVVIGDHRVNLLFDVGEIGLKPTLCHGHSDILSFNLFVDGKPIIVDCGSYQYNAHFKKMREYFHGVHSHNTLSIDGKDQAIAGEGMFWLSYPNVFIDDYEENNDYVKCTAHHDGYVRKGMNAIHQRTMVYHKKTCSIEILDKIKTVEKHQGEYTLHFHPNVKVTHQGNSLLLDDKIIVKNEWFKNGYLMKGNEEKPMGWYSERYDSIEPTYSFVLPFDIDGETHLETSIIIK